MCTCVKERVYVCVREPVLECVYTVCESVHVCEKERERVCMGSAV